MNTADSYVPDYLTSEYPGDYGLDSAGDAADPKTVERLREAEVLHDHLIPELLQEYTAINNGASKGVWFKADAMIFQFDSLNYMGACVLVRAQFIFVVIGLPGCPDGCHRGLPCEWWSIRWT